MRMDPQSDPSAADLVNEASERDLQTIFRRYGEERYARQIAKAIVRERRRQPFTRTGELVDTIKAAMPAPARFGDGHPAKRVFQALRIAVNDELDELERYFRQEERGCVCPPEFPVCTCGREPALRVLTRRALRPDARETALNPRAASARLRAAEKV
jgi:16S rRNA (cytosine1402-N4)-methyltransferase